MKKLLGLTALAAVLVLSACDGSSDETVCRVEEMGSEVVVTIASEDGIITSRETETRIAISELGEELAEMMAEEDGVQIDGDYLVVSETESVDGEDLDELIEEMESMGATCN